MGVYVREKNGRLYLDIYTNGKRTWEALHLTLTHDRAQNKEMRKLAEVCRAKKEMRLVSGEWNIKDSEAGRISIAEYAAKIAAMPNRSEVIAACAKKLESYAGGRTQTGAISAAWIKDFQDYLKTNTGLALSSAAAYSNALRAILNQAVKDNILIKNPATGVSNLKAPEKSVSFLTTPEMRALFSCADNPKRAETAKAFFFGCYTGLRISDLRTLEWGQINKSPLQIIKRQKKTKSEVCIPLSATAWALINDEKEHREDENIFKLPSETATYIILEKWAKDADIKKNLTWHMARKTFATQSLDHGAEIYTVAKLLGHRGLNQVARYAEATDKLKRAAVDRLPVLSSD
ncbi:MAG: site-specific integrase [Spirochaetaceae bacterium]|jgi:integrase|nr:site-specific integrase [Spirochaetaceae bacterium]